MATTGLKPISWPSWCAAPAAALLLDVNNVYISAHNLGTRATDYLDAFPVQAIAEIHLAGHHADFNWATPCSIDSHDAPVADAVWALYEHLIARTGPRPTLIERDDQLPLGRTAGRTRACTRPAERL